MKKLSIIIFLTTALTATLPARSDSMATQPHSPREKLLQEYPIIQNDSIEQSKDYLFENALLYLQKGDTQKAYQSLHTCPFIRCAKTRIPCRSVWKMPIVTTSATKATC